MKLKSFRNKREEGKKKICIAKWWETGQYSPQLLPLAPSWLGKKQTPVGKTKTRGAAKTEAEPRGCLTEKT